MKFLLFLSLITISTTSFAFQDKCYETAKKAAFQHAKDGEEIITMKDFEDIYGNEMVDVENQSSWQKEFWSFYNYSSIVNVEVHSVKGKCIVKNVDSSQNDQDE